MGIKVSIDGEGYIVIKRKKKEAGEDHISKQASEMDQSNSGKPGRSVSLTLLRNVIDQMEIRAEGVFRPDMPDVETAYGLSGDNSIDMLHKFTSNEVIKDGFPSAIYTSTDKKIKYIIEERGKAPELLVDVHTHPNGIAELSEKDRETMKKIAQVFKERLPSVKAYFGVHAISGEEKFGKRVEPKASGNRIKWRSITRYHEAAFYDENARPMDVMIREP